MVLGARRRSLEGSKTSSRFRNTNNATDHQTPAHRVKDCKWMNDPGSHPVGSERDECVNTTLPKGYPEDDHDKDTGRDGCPLIIFHLPRLVCKQRSSHIEPRQPTNATHHKVNKNESVPHPSQTQCESKYSWCHAERNNVS